MGIYCGFCALKSDLLQKTPGEKEGAEQVYPFEHSQSHRKVVQAGTF